MGRTRAYDEDAVLTAAGLEGLRKLFTTLLHEPNDTVDGCLITHSAIEFGRKRALAGSGVAEGLRQNPSQHDR